MTLFSLARSVTNRRADGGPGVFNSQNSPFANNHFRTMADVCEAFSFFRVFNELQKTCPFVSIRVHSWFLITVITHPWLGRFSSPIPPESPWPHPGMFRTFPPWAARNRIPSDGRVIRRSCNGIRCPIGCMELRRACHSAYPESVMISMGRCSMPRNLDDNSFSNLLYPPTVLLIIILTINCMVWWKLSLSGNGIPSHSDIARSVIQS